MLIVLKVSSSALIVVLWCSMAKSRRKRWPVLTLVICTTQWMTKMGSNRQSGPGPLGKVLSYTDTCPGGLCLGLLAQVILRVVNEHPLMSLAGGWYPQLGVLAGGGLPNSHQLCSLAANNRKRISSRGPTTPAVMQVVFLGNGQGSKP